MTYHAHLLSASSAFPALQNWITAKGPLDIPLANMGCAADHLTRAIVGQQLSVKAATTIWQRLCDAAGNTPFHAFFVPENVALLRSCGLSYSKIRAASAVHSYFHDHALDDATLAALPHTERVQRLTQIWGIGPWTCDMMSLFYFRDPDIWAVGDGGLMRAVGMLINTEKPTSAQMHDFGEDFAPYRSMLSLYLWRMLDNEPKMKQGLNP